jgi:hypothetical protein
MARKKSVSRKKSAGRTKQGRKTKGTTGRYIRDELTEQHEKRTKHAQIIDEALTAPRAPTAQAWKEHPDKYDVPGIDMPLEWRSQNERDSIATIKERIKKYSGKPGFQKVVQMDREKLALLEWQAKHPFIHAGDLSTQEGLGKEYYERALKSNNNYGFDLTKPQKSFLDEHNLKQRDIKGMRVIVYPSLRLFRSTGGAKDSTLGFYRINQAVMHIPPISKIHFAASERRKKTIIHEIGHHIYHQSDEFRNRWRTDTIKMRRLTGSGTTKPALVSRPYDRSPTITFEKISPWEVIGNPQHFFGSDYMFDLSPWKQTHLNEGGTLRSWELSETKKGEAWAEAFNYYRSGELKDALMLTKMLLDNCHDAMKKVSKQKSAYTGKKNTKEWHGFKRQERMVQDQINYYGAIWENQRALIDWITKMDKQGWLLPDPKVRPKPRRKKKK